jgi:hypothetical protein
MIRHLNQDEEVRVWLTAIREDAATENVHHPCQNTLNTVRRDVWGDWFNGMSYEKK